FNIHIQSRSIKKARIPSLIESIGTTFYHPIILMATTEQQPKAAVTKEAKIDLFEDDDEFEEFDINHEWDVKEEGKEVTQQWEDDWDDDDVNDDFSLQLRRELESNVEKK
ncbi:hypothetical protein M8C21_030280, partial [Ambrosia artemisiifolia]